MIYSILYSASQLPVEWDDLCISYFQKREFLIYLEKMNPCNQKYYILYEGNHIIAGAVVYLLKLDLFTYSKFALPVKMNIAGIPCSVSTQGYIGNTKSIKLVHDYVYSCIKGLTLSLNLDDVSKLTRKAIIGKTLPSTIFQVTFTNWEDYLNSLRYEYRRRVRFVLNLTTGIVLKKDNCSNFTKEMYDLYLQVFRKSEAKLELLSYDFFKNLPPKFELTVCYDCNDIASWYITLRDNETLVFFMGGINYSNKHSRYIYIRNLIEIIKTGIDLKVKFVDLGQTAEIPKLRSGGTLKPLFLTTSHSNSIANFLLKKFIGVLEYTNKIPQHKVFKDSL